MKNVILKTKYVFLALIMVLTFSCSKEDDTPLANRSPENFNLIEVADEATDIGLNPTFNWQATTDPDGDTVVYDLLLGNDSDNLQNIASGLNTTTYTIDDKLPLIGKLYWKVIAKDNTGNFTESKTFSFTTRNLIFTEVTSAAFFSARQSATLTTYDDKLWLVAGFDGNLRNDTFSTSNTINWHHFISSGSFSERTRHTSVLFDNKLLVIGGAVSNGGLENDVWNSSDGSFWNELAAAGGRFSARERHTSVVFDNKVWVIGGDDGNLKNDVWSSIDGHNWVRVTETALFSPRSSHSTVVFDDKIWVIGGFDGTNRVNDVWNSNDGVSWTEVTSEANFSGRSEHTSVAFDNKLWVIAGFDGSLNNDVWSSKNGVTWIKVPTSDRFSERTFHATAVFDNKIWLMGGFSGELKNDVWVMD